MSDKTNNTTNETKEIEQIEAAFMLGGVRQYIENKGTLDESAAQALEVLELKLGIAGTLPEESENEGAK